MKLSELSTDETFNVLCEITPAVQCILKDESLSNAIGKAADIKGMTPAGIIMLAVDRFSEAVPILMKTHRDDVFQILASVNRISKEDVAKQRFAVTLSQIDDAIHDEDLINFFKSCMPRGKKGPSGHSAKPRG